MELLLLVLNALEISVSQFYESQFQNCQLFNQTTSNIQNGLWSLGSDYACSPLNAGQVCEVKIKYKAMSNRQNFLMS